MKFIKVLPEIALYAFLSFISIFVIAGGWQFFIQLFFDFEYIRVVENLCAIMTSILIIWIMKTYFYKSFISFFNSTKHFEKTLGISLAALFIVFLTYLFWIYLLSDSGLISIKIHPDFWATTNFMVKSLLAGITVAIGEEIVHRGFLFNAIYHKTKNKSVAIIISSIFFCLGHFYYDSVIDFIVAFGAGVLLCILYIKYKSIYPPIFFHFSWNFSYVFFSLIRNLPRVENNPLFSTTFLGLLDDTPEFFSLIILITLSSILLFIHFTEKLFKYFKKPIYSLQSLSIKE